MRISDWSSDVCSSDLQDIANGFVAVGGYADAVALVHGTGSRAYGWRRNGGRSVATASPAMMRPEGAGADLSRPMASNAHHAWTSCNQRHASSSCRTCSSPSVPDQYPTPASAQGRWPADHIQAPTATPHAPGRSDTRRGGTR